MADKAQVYWIEPPDGLAKALEEYGRMALAAVHATAAYVGQKMQNEARSGKSARWEDRTENARGGIFFAVDGFGLETLVGEVKPGDPASFERDREDGGKDSGSDTELILILGHTMYYGRFLELANAGKWASVLPTVEANLPVLKKMLDEVFD